MQIPTRDQIAEVVNEARQAGREAAEHRYREIGRGASPGTELVNELGGAHLILLVDGRTRIGRFVRSLMSDPIPGLSVSQQKGWGYHFSISDLCPYQEISVNEAAQNAAWRVLRKALPVEAQVVRYPT